MNKFRSFINGFYQLSWWRDKAFPYLMRHPTKRYLKRSYSPPAPECRLMDEDWDNLILLDACRYDQFVRHNKLSGEVETRTSLGSATPEFLTNNFEGTAHYDTVYVTANPMYRIKELNNVFHDVVDVWKFGWDEQWQTVLPDTMAEAVLNSYQEYPDKRLFAHFMQPHYPFIGETSEDVGRHAGFELSYRLAQGEDAKRDHPTVWSMLEDGELEAELVWEAYNESLEIALDHVEELVEKFTEKTVITSDHGNLVGERLIPFGRPQYGHPAGVYVDELRRVPWLVIEGNERKTVTSEKPGEQDTGTPSTVTDRLSDLGYVDI